MAIAEIIKYEGDNSTFVWKHPKEDFNSLTQLIVHESQEAIFFMNGQALDLFGPGRYSLESQNIPLVGKALKKATGGDTPFHCEVYFINKTVQMGIKWGTPELVHFIEPTYGVPLAIGASGELNLAVSDSRKLLVKLVGTMRGIAWEEGRQGFTKSIQNAFRALIVTEVKAHLANAIKEQNIDLLEIDGKLDELSEGLRQKLLPGFDEYGLTIPQIYVSTINIPESDPNFKRLRELHTVNLQTKVAEASVTIEAAQRKVLLEEETTKTELAKREAERKLIDAQVEAQSQKLKGIAEADVMKAKGYTYRDELQAEVQKEYAKGIGMMGSNGGSGAGITSDFVGLGVGLAAAGQIGAQMGDMFKGLTPTQTIDSVSCPKCGASIPANSKFCLECGSKVESLQENEIICPACGAKTAKGKFCQECGAPLVHKCPKCDAEISNGAKFCQECGERL